MKKLITKFAIIMVLVIACGCQSNEQTKTIAVWKIYKLEDYKIPGFSDTLTKDEKEIMKSFVMDYYGYAFINFYSDTGCIIRKGTDFINAQWTSNESGNTIIISEKKGKSELQESRFKIGRIADSILVFKFKPDSGIVAFYKQSKGKDEGFSDFIGHTDFVFMFKKDFFIYERKTDDIHSFINNAWRIKPEKPESDAQLKERVKASVNYTKIYINDAFNRGEHYYCTRAVTAPLKLYSGAVRLLEKEKISKEWLDVFYNREQAMQAYQILINAFKKDLTTTQRKNWVQTDVEILNKICEKI